MFKDNLKNIRVSKNISQRELGRRINKTGQYISYLENTSEGNPSLDVIQAISEALNVSPYDLLNDVEQIKKEVKEFELIDNLLTLYGYELSTYSSEQMVREGKVTLSDNGDIDFSKTPCYHIKLNSKKSIILTEPEFEEFKNSLKKFIDFELFRLKDKK